MHPTETGVLVPAIIHTGVSFAGDDATCYAIEHTRTSALGWPGRLVHPSEYLAYGDLGRGGGRGGGRGSRGGYDRRHPIAAEPDESAYESADPYPVYEPDFAPEEEAAEVYRVAPRRRIVRYTVPHPGVPMYGSLGAWGQSYPMPMPMFQSGYPTSAYPQAMPAMSYPTYPQPSMYPSAYPMVQPTYVTEEEEEEEEPSYPSSSSGGQRRRRRSSKSKAQQRATRKRMQRRTKRRMLRGGSSGSSISAMPMVTSSGLMTASVPSSGLTTWSTGNWSGWGSPWGQWGGSRPF